MSLTTVCLDKIWQRHPLLLTYYVNMHPLLLTSYVNIHPSPLALTSPVKSRLWPPWFDIICQPLAWGSARSCGSGGDVELHFVNNILSWCWMFCRTRVQKFFALHTLSIEFHIRGALSTNPIPIRGALSTNPVPIRGALCTISNPSRNALGTDRSFFGSP